MPTLDYLPIKPVVLYRDAEFTHNQKELNAIRDYFVCTPSRTAIKPFQTVIGRYSVLPFYRELEIDLALLGAKMINTYQQHCYVADLHNWYADLEPYTPKTYFHLSDVQGEGPFVLKGQTNSCKHLWWTHMYAATKADVIRVYQNLSADSLVGRQSIYVREYVPLKTYMIGVNGQPIVEEYRFFVAYQTVLSGGYYWSSHSEDLREQNIFPNYHEVPDSFLESLVKSIGNRCNFYTLDVARTIEGNWILIEINDGQMAGLSDNDPWKLYSKLARTIEEQT